MFVVSPREKVRSPAPADSPSIGADPIDPDAPLSRPPAVVLGLNPNGLGLVRSLTQVGIRVIAVGRAPMDTSDTHLWMSSRTRLCTKVLVEPGSGDTAFLEALDLVAADLTEPAPVFPSGDSFLYLLSKHRERLAPHFRFVLPDPETLELLLQKGRFHAFCEREEIAAPATAVGLTSGTLDEVLPGFRFPCLLKPEYRDARWDGRFAPAKALVAENEKELRSHVGEAEATGADLMLQEIIPGPDTELHFSHAYFGRDSRPVALWTGRKLRQYPPGFGTSTLAETKREPEVARITERIALALGLRGYVSVEFKRDHRDGSFRILEVTPGRTWYPHFLGTTAGINLPHLWYRDLLDESLPDQPPLHPPDGIAWIDEYRDLVAAFESWQRGEIGLGQWLRSYEGVRSFALFSPLDPLPGLFVMARLALSIFRKFGGARPSVS